MYGNDDIYGAHSADEFGFDEDEDMEMSFGEIGDVVGDDMFGARPRRRAGRRKTVRRAVRRGRKQGRKQVRRRRRRRPAGRGSAGRGAGASSGDSEYWQMVGGSPAWEQGLVPGQEGGGYDDGGYDDGYEEEPYEEEDGALEAMADELLYDEGYGAQPLAPRQIARRPARPSRPVFQPTASYGDHPVVVVHEPPGETAFTNSLKVGFGVGLGVVGALTVASLVGRAFR